MRGLERFNFSSGVGQLFFPGVTEHAFIILLCFFLPFHYSRIPCPTWGASVHLFCITLFVSITLTMYQYHCTQTSNPRK